MKETMNAHYALLQFVDDERLEVANVGMVLIIPEAELARLRLGQNQVAKMMVERFGSTSGFEVMLEGFAERLRNNLQWNVSPKVIENFKPSGDNPLCVSVVRDCIIRDPDADFERLFNRLVN
jgi:hypothetical protein